MKQAIGHQNIMSGCSLAAFVVARTTGIHYFLYLALIFLSLALYCLVRTRNRLLPHAGPLHAGETEQESLPGKAPAERESGTGYRVCAAPAVAVTPHDVPAGFIPITFQTRKEHRFATATGGIVTIGAGTVRATLRMELYPQRTPGEEMDIIDCRLQVADGAGHTWECRQLMLPFLLTDPIEPGAMLPPSGFIFGADVPAPWQEALVKTCIIAGVQNRLDTGDVGQLRIGDTGYRIYFKDQCPLIDVAYLDAEAALIVRISQLNHDMIVDGTVTGSAALPPFCYAVPAEELLFLTAPHHYYSYYEEWYAMEEGMRKRAPLFTGLHRKDSPQPLVRLLA